MGIENEDTTHKPFASATADRLLDLLSTDDDFRTLFANDRHAALAKAGYAAAPDAGLDCCQVTNLASKEEIAGARDQLRSQLTSQGVMTVIFCFEAEKMGSTTDR